MAASPPASALVLLTDFSDAAVLAAAKQGLQQFASALSLQAAAPAGPPAAAVPAPSPLPPAHLVLGLCSLSRPPGAPKPVLAVRYRPGPFLLREFHAAVARLTHVGAAAGGGPAGIDGATAAAALQQLVGVVAQDAACAAAGPNKTVLLLTDRVDYEASDFFPALEFCRSKGVRLEVVLLEAAAPELATGSVPAATLAAEGGHTNGSSPGGVSAATAALAAAWGAAEALFPHLSVTIVQGASRLSFAALASSLLQRCSAQPQLAVSLQFKQPLIGSVRSLPLACTTHVRPLSQAQALSHAALCPCHRAPANQAPLGGALACSITGAPLDRRQCGRDERTVQVGGSAAGALHLGAPFDIASAAGAAGGAGATLSVLSRVKTSGVNPALTFGLPLMLAPSSQGGIRGGGEGTMKVVHEGALLDVSTGGLLGALCSSLRSSQEALLAVSSTDLESGAAGLLRLHYLLLPCQPSPGQPALLLARRVACAEELLAQQLAFDGAPAAGSASAAEEVPAAVAEAVAAQLAAVPAAEALDPLALSGRSGEVVEMLVRESQPMPRPQAPPPQAPAPAARAGPGPNPAAAPTPAGQPAGQQAQQQEAPAANAAAQGAAPARVRRPAAASGGAKERAGPKQGAGGKGALQLRRAGRQ